MAVYPIYKGIQKHGCRQVAPSAPRRFLLFRKIFTLVGLISAISTALCPVAASIGFWMFLFVRLLQGIGFAACLPVVGAVTSAWARIAENGLFNGALTSFIQIAPLITVSIKRSYSIHQFKRCPSAESCAVCSTTGRQFTM